MPKQEKITELWDVLPEKLADVEHDAFDYKDVFVPYVSKILKKSKPPFVYVISGGWGSGKSTFIRYLIESLPNPEEKNIIVYFNAWESSIHNDIRSCFVDELIEQLSKVGSYRGYGFSDRDFRNCKKILLDAAIEAFADWNIVTKYASKVYKKSRDLEKKDFRKIVRSEKIVRNEFLRLGQYLSKKGIIVYVIIDELDRCQPQLAVKMVESLRMFFTGRDQIIEAVNINNGLKVDRKNDSIPIKYILAVDEQFLERAFATEYKLRYEDANRYLTKFIQLKYHFPKKNWTKFVDMYLKAYGNSNWKNNVEGYNKELGRDDKGINVESRIYSELLSELNLTVPRDVAYVIKYLLIWQEMHYYHRIDEIRKRKDIVNIDDVLIIVIKYTNILLFMLGCVIVIYPSMIYPILNSEILVKNHQYLMEGNENIKELLNLISFQHIEGDKNKIEEGKIRKFLEMGILYTREILKKEFSKNPSHQLRESSLIALNIMLTKISSI